MSLEANPMALTIWFIPFFLNMFKASFLRVERIEGTFPEYILDALIKEKTYPHKPTYPMIAEPD